MTTALPVNFRKDSPLVPTVDFIDFATGTGLEPFYPGDANSTSADVPGSYFLTNATINSDVGSTQSGENAALDLDFDTVLNRPITLEGDCVISVPLLHVNNGGGTADVTSTITGELQHYDGTTETNLGTDTCAADRSVNSQQRVHNRVTVKFTVAKTKFKKGDTLRITVKSSAPGSGEEIIIGHDPAGRTDLFTGSILGDTSWNGSAQILANIPIRANV
tara:strand:- start:70 stop:726 length:657 start_codon:yes stop_codon:yes gene_type:complete